MEVTGLRHSNLELQLRCVPFDVDRNKMSNKVQYVEFYSTLLLIHLISVSSIPKYLLLARYPEEQS